jgi:two-component system OmpR family response regulator
MMNKTHKILIVEDNAEMQALIARALKKEGYRVSLGMNGKEMFRALDNEKIDLVLLDLMLPGSDGLTLCRDLRARSDIPVIMITAKGEEMDRVLGLKMGADDYIAKPFSTLELLARIEAVLRRSQSSSVPSGEDTGTCYEFSGWRFDIEKRELTSPDEVMVSLSTGEYALLLVFVERPKRVLARETLLDLTRGRDAVAFDRSIDTQVSRLRRKIEPDPKNPEIIKTVWRF